MIIQLLCWFFHIYKHSSLLRFIYWEGTHCYPFYLCWFLIYARLIHCAQTYMRHWVQTPNCLLCIVDMPYDATQHKDQRKTEKNQTELRIPQKKGDELWLAEGRSHTVYTNSIATLPSVRTHCYHYTMPMSVFLSMRVCTLRTKMQHWYVSISRNSLLFAAQWCNTAWRLKMS